MNTTYRGAIDVNGAQRTKKTKRGGGRGDERQREGEMNGALWPGGMSGRMNVCNWFRIVMYTW